MADQANAGDRAKAYRLRKLAKTGTLGSIDALWLADYDEQQEQRARRRGGDAGASRAKSGRKVKFEMEEAAESEAVGYGTAAAAAASAALAVKEEGRRLDSLTIESVGALKEAVEVYKSICHDLRAQNRQYADHHMGMLDAVREQYLARTQAEINALEASSAGGDAMTKMAESLLPNLFHKNGAKPA